MGNSIGPAPLAVGTRVRIANADSVPADMAGREGTIAARALTTREAYWLTVGTTTNAGPYYRDELDALTREAEAGAGAEAVPDATDAMAQERVLALLDRLMVVAHYSEARRVLNIGIPVATALTRGWVAALTSEGAEHMAETEATLTLWVEALQAHPTMTVREWWTHYDATIAARRAVDSTNHDATRLEEL